MKAQICTIYLNMHIQNIKIYLVLLDSPVWFGSHHGCLGVAFFIHLCVPLFSAMNNTCITVVVTYVQVH